MDEWETEIADYLDDKTETSIKRILQEKYKVNDFSTGMFLYEPDLNTTQLMPKPSTMRSGTFEQLDSLVSYANLRDKWHYHLTQKLPDLLLRYD